MDFKDYFKQIPERASADKLKLLNTEEATKNALIMPFIIALGYDVFNPLEVIPEMTCDIGTKKGEKIDYAILKDGEPIILIECKHWQQDLNLHDNQLLRYFNVSKAKFGVLTNGIIYRFYTDLKEQNKMDEKPFLEINILDLKEAQIEELKRFHKSYFDLESILSSASELKYMGELKSVILSEFASPTPEFVKYLGKQVYDGSFTPKVLEQFTILVKKSISAHITDLISDRLKAAIKKEETEQTEEVSDPGEDQQLEEKKDGIITTEEELQGFYIIKAILRNTISADRITYRDAKSYFSVLLDNNNRKLICRLYFNSPTNKRITFSDENKKEQHNKIEPLDDIYQYSQQVIDAALRYVRAPSDQENSAGL